MTNVDAKKFALALAQADTEREVIDLLREAGYWDEDSAWREYGNNPMNYSTIGNQQSSADNALVEKLVNSVDAVLMRECLKQEIDPSSNKAPQNIAEAQKKFFNIHNGKLSGFDSKQRTALAEDIWLVATGSKTKPSYSIIDRGEGQSPQRMPGTILSLTKNNKIKIPFVQGKFGMGGTGVLRFCSPKNSMLLIVSKRNHQIDAKTDQKIYGEDKTRDLWGVTVVRREDPKGGEKSSRYTYLAPNKEILSFGADELPLLPESLKSGTFIKLYEYDLPPRLKTHIGFDLYYRLALLMPDVALPIKLAEHRKQYPHSDEKTLAGLSVRLDEDKNKNLEPEFRTPSSGGITVEGQKLDYLIYVFKKGKKESYAKNEGVVFSINGQAHGFLPKAFFTRKAVGKSYLSDSILVTIDCSNISRRKQEELFMPTRDRLADAVIRNSIEKELEDIIKNHSGLKELQNRRRQEAIGDKLRDSKPIADVLEDMIKKQPALSNLFSPGARVSDPFGRKVPHQEEFEGKKFPTYFNSVKEYTEKKPKHCSINHRKFRIEYKTDAENDYFNRDRDPGELTLELDDGSYPDYSNNLWNGRSALTISIPKSAKSGETLCFETKVSDICQTKPFTNKFYILPDNEPKGPPGPNPPKPTPRQKKSYNDLPNVCRIKREDWDKNEYKEFGFNQSSALKVKSAEERRSYDFFINVDNVHLKTEMKNNTQTNPVILEERYCAGMVLLGISILHFEENCSENRTDNGDDSNGDESSVYDQISRLTEAVSLAWLPMIASLGSLESEA